MSAFLRLDGLVKRFADTLAVDRVSLALERGEMLALLGPSGSGKTTTLRLLAGFETPDEGKVLVEGEDLTRVEPVSRRFGMVFQHYALFPHLDVRANVGFGLESIGVRGAERDRRVARSLALVDLDGFGERRIAQLSGGQQQRVALARALAPEPRVLLLDEPLSNLDPTLRERTRRELRDVIRRVGITTVLVTHEQDEAFELGDRVAVMRDGRLEQVGTPDELYGAPANVFVGGFVGRSSTAEVVVVGSTERPEALRLTLSVPAALPATVTGRRFVGPSALFTVRTDGGAVLDVVAAPQAAPAGARVGLMPSRRMGGGIHLFPPDGR